MVSNMKTGDWQSQTMEPLASKVLLCPPIGKEVSSGCACRSCSLEKVARRLALNWGIIPVLYEEPPSEDARIEAAISIVKKITYVEEGDTLIITADHLQRVGGTDMIRVVTL